jgi:hypothetical protein
MIIKIACRSHGRLAPFFYISQYGTHTFRQLTLSIPSVTKIKLRVKVLFIRCAMMMSYFYKSPPPIN